jgi:hypothetical protein
VNYHHSMGGLSSQKSEEFWACPHDAPSPEIYPGPRLSFKPSHSLSARLAAYHSALVQRYVRKRHRCFPSRNTRVNYDTDDSYPYANWYSLGVPYAHVNNYRGLKLTPI